MAVPCVRQLVGGLSPRGSGFDPRSVHVRLVVDKVATVQGFLRLLLFSSTSISPPMLHTHFHLHVAVNEGQTDEDCKLSNKQYSFGNRGPLVRKALSCF